MKFTKTNFLTSALIAGMILSSCNKFQEQKAAREQEEKAKQEQLTLQRQAEQNTFYEHARDSIAAANGYSTGSVAKLNKKRTIENQQADSLERKLTMRHKMADEIDAMRTTQIQALNKRYNVYNIEVSESYNQQNATYLPIEVPNLTKDNTIFFYVSGLDNYGDARQQEIITSLKKDLVQTEKTIQQQALSIAKKYAKYYPIFDMEKYVPKQYQQYINPISEFYSSDSDGTFWTSGRIDQYSNYRKNIKLHRVVSVYDSKLNPSFFTDTECTYSLENVAQNKWQVTKTNKNGKVEKSAVFSDNKSWDYTTYFYDEENTSFSTSAGENIGVRVTVTENLLNIKPQIENDTIQSVVQPWRAAKEKVQQTEDMILSQQRIYWSAEEQAKQMMQNKYQNQK